MNAWEPKTNLAKYYSLILWCPSDEKKDDERERTFDANGQTSVMPDTSRTAPSHVADRPLVLSSSELTQADFRAAAIACEAQGNIHDHLQSEEEHIATVAATRGRQWHDLALKFAGVEWSQSAVVMSRAWAMPSSETFSLPPVSRLMDRWLVDRYVIVDPFARNSRRGTLRNDLSLATDAEFHMEARDFLRYLVGDCVSADAILFDPPYSPRQIQETYQSIGRTIGKEDTQSARLYAECRDIAARLLVPGAIAISCGWNSGGFGKKRGFEQREILLVAHGAAHNDTIVTVEEKVL